MHKVTLISLAEGAYQYPVDEAAYIALADYLSRAESRLRTNPDRTEVLGDLEQSIGEKLGSTTRQNNRPLTYAEVIAVLEQLGPVDGGSEQWEAPPYKTPVRRRRLYRIRENQKIAGICTGLSAYADLDVTLIRVLLVLLTFFTGGVMILIYIVAMFIIPVANTPEEYAAARGLSAT